MFVRIWQFAVAAPDSEGFEAAYGPNGDWARLFARTPGFIGTELLRGGIGAMDLDVTAWVTIDRWRDRADWLRFLEDHGDEYRALDLQSEALTRDETEIGDFVSD